MNFYLNGSPYPLKALIFIGTYVRKLINAHDLVFNLLSCETGFERIQELNSGLSCERVIKSQNVTLAPPFLWASAGSLNAAITHTGLLIFWTHPLGPCEVGWSGEQCELIWLERREGESKRGEGRRGGKCAGFFLS